jgi:hypothetical protein
LRRNFELRENKQGKKNPDQADFLFLIFGVIEATGARQDRPFADPWRPLRRPGAIRQQTDFEGATEPVEPLAALY